MDGGPAAAPPGDLVARAFGLGAVREPPGYAARGEMGVVWRLVTDAAERALDAGRRPVDRDRSARWLPTILDHLLTVARAERILDLCAAR